MIVPNFAGPISAVAVSDGLSNTVLAGERNYNLNFAGQSLLMYDENDGYEDAYDWDVIRWGDNPPIPDRRDNSDYSYQFGSSHFAGCLFVLGDGSVRFVHYGVNQATFLAACVRNDGVFGADLE
jgi:hypothetical protein